MKLPELYRESLKQHLSAQKMLTLEMLVCQLQIYQKMTIEGLAARLPLPILFESRRKHVQRFLKLDELETRGIWLPLIKRIVNKRIKPGSRIYLAIDRTQWKGRNVFFVSLIIGQRAYPIIWEILDKEGASNLEEQKNILFPVIELLDEYEIVVLGDREFHGVELAKWLDRKGVYYVLREKKDLQVKGTEGEYSRIDSREMHPGIKEFKIQVTIVKKKGFAEGSLAIYWKRKYRGKGEKEAWYLLTNLGSLEESINSYKKRMGVEEMFRDQKKGGYNLEDCRGSNQRLNTLIWVMSIAYTIASLKGKAIKAAKQAKYVGRQRKVKQKLTKNSEFKLGLYGQIFINENEILEELGQKLMSLTPHKWGYYYRGMRAMSLIKQAF